MTKWHTALCILNCHENELMHCLSIVTMVGPSRGHEYSTVTPSINDSTCNEWVQIHVANKTLDFIWKYSNSYHSMYGNQRTLPCSNIQLYRGGFCMSNRHIKPFINKVFSLFSFSKCHVNWLQTALFKNKRCSPQFHSSTAIIFENYLQYFNGRLPSSSAAEVMTSFMTSATNTVLTLAPR